MTLDGSLVFGFLLVFVRCSAMLLSSPVFGAQNTPVNVRILTTLAISGALTSVVRPALGPLPTDLPSLLIAVGTEAVAGLLLGSFMNLALQVGQIAGGVLDMQIGLGTSQVMNPVTSTGSAHAG